MKGPREYFALMVLAFVTVSSAFGDSARKGLISLFIGLALALVGIDQLTGQARLSFGQPELLDGIEVTTMAVAMFAVGEALAIAGNALEAELVDTDGDGEMDTRFSDTDKDGKLSKAEFAQWMVALKSQSDPSTKADAPATKKWVGTAFADYAGLTDAVIDVSVLPNRPDCMGVRGIARDLAAAGIGTNSAPMDSTCSATSGRTS